MSKWVELTQFKDGSKGLFNLDEFSVIAPHSTGGTELIKSPSDEVCVHARESFKQFRDFLFYGTPIREKLKDE